MFAVQKLSKQTKQECHCKGTHGLSTSFEHPLEGIYDCLPIVAPAFLQHTASIVMSNGKVVQINRSNPWVQYLHLFRNRIDHFTSRRKVLFERTLHLDYPHQLCACSADKA